MGCSTSAASSEADEGRLVVQSTNCKANCTSSSMVSETANCQFQFAGGDAPAEPCARETAEEIQDAYDNELLAMTMLASEEPSPNMFGSLMGGSLQGPLETIRESSSIPDFADFSSVAEHDKLDFPVIQHSKSDKVKASDGQSFSLSRSEVAALVSSQIVDHQTGAGLMGVLEKVPRSGTWVDASHPDSIPFALPVVDGETELASPCGCSASSSSSLPISASAARSDVDRSSKVKEPFGVARVCCLSSQETPHEVCFCSEKVLDHDEVYVPKLLRVEELHEEAWNTFPNVDSEVKVSDEALQPFSQRSLDSFAYSSRTSTTMQQLSQRS